MHGGSQGTHLAGYGEFPGGKVHDRENHGDALRREILEELNTGIVNTRRIFFTEHAYEERMVELHFYRGDLTPERRAALGQELRWITREEFPRSGISAGRRRVNRRPAGCEAGEPPTVTLRAGHGVFALHIPQCQADCPGPG